MSLPSRAAAFVRSLPDHQLLDRLVRGRAWIPVLGVMLAGIVAMQVEVLKLNASMGRSISLASSLQTRNELLRTSVSSLSDAHRIERLAARMGMVMPGPTSVEFLTGHATASRAIAGIHPPDAATFNSALQASNLQAAAATTPTSSTAATSTSTAGTTSAGTTQASSTTTTPTVPSTSGPSTATSIASSGTGAAATGATGVTVTPAATGATGATATTPSATSVTANPGGAASGG